MRFTAWFLAALAALPIATGARAEGDAPDKPPARPAIKSNRWQEDWSPLADPALRTAPLDALKYIPLAPGNPKSYLSLGATLRERYEINSAPAFGTGRNFGDGYLLQRFQFHADLHFNENWRAFAQVEDARVFGKKSIGGADQNQLDLRLAFTEYTQAFADGTMKARVGRQEFAFDLQRFVSLRDGPNVRQAFDAAWLDWESGPWRLIGFVSQPVIYYRGRAFDDTSRGSLRFHTLRIERQVFGQNELSAYYSFFGRDNARYLDAVGNEERHIFDARFAGGAQGFDWDLEAMGQAGTVGPKDIRAWALGGRAGYTFSALPLQPRVGLQADAASGDRHPGDGKVSTFNPLFPNGYYFTLGGFTGYTNLIHLKPSVTLKPFEKVTLLAAIGLQWRETTADAVYTQPNIAVPNTAGRPGRYTGAYGQLRLDWAVTANLSAAIEAVHFRIGDAVRRAGGHDGDYLGMQLAYAW